MLLSNKKMQGDEQNWCVVLNPVRNEIDKKKIALKISQVFSLSEEESADLVSNTPIILLDNLTFKVATQVKEYFNASGAELALTNDILRKRKYYRTIWPEQPNLSFLRGWQHPVEVTHEHEALAPDDALNAIRSLNQEEPKRSHSEVTSVPVFTFTEREQLLEDVEKWRKSCEVFQDESRKLREQLNRLEKEKLAKGAAQTDLDSALREREKEVKEIKALLLHAEEKHEVLKDEYRQARSLFEEKITASGRENEQLNKKIKELTEAFGNFEREKQNLLKSLTERDLLNRKLEEEKTQVRNHYQEKLLQNSQEVDQWKIRAEMETKKAFVLEKAKEDFCREEQSMRERMEERCKDLEKGQVRFIQEVEARSAEVLEWQLKCAELEKAMAELRQTAENQQKIFQANQKQLETYERELELSRKQVRDIYSQTEQREAIQKRTQLASELATKEALLKNLVKEQERIEAEIRGREESIRKILSEQEAVEKEIIQDKQAQRHLLEQLKKEKPAVRGSVHKVNRPVGGIKQESSEEGDPGLLPDD